MRRTTGAALVLVGVHCFIGATEMAHSDRPLPDFVRYYEIASSPGRPYVDYQVEHPPGTLAVFKALAAIGGNRQRFAFGLVAVNLVADLTIVAVMWAAWDVTAAIAYLAIMWPMLAIVLNRVDLLSTGCAAVAVAAWRTRRVGPSAAAFAAGTAFKLWPLPLSLLLVLERDASRRARALYALAAGYGLLAAVWVAIAGVRGLWQVLTFREAHGWQIESTVGSLLLLAAHPILRLESGAWRTGSIPTLVPLALFMLAAPMTLLAVRGASRSGRVGAGWIAAIGALLLCSALFSAQYVVWLVPAAAIAWREGDRGLTWLTGLAVVLTGIFMRKYNAVIALALPAVSVVVVRNVVLALTVALAARALMRGTPPRANSA